MFIEGNDTSKSVESRTLTMEQINALTQNKEQQNLDKQSDSEVELNRKFSSAKIADMMEVNN